MITLRPVEREDYRFLFEMLKEREPYQSISFTMPTWESHIEFMERKVYSHHYIVFEGEERVGNIYLTVGNEWGYFILNKHQGRGLGINSIQELMKKHPRKYYLANINPENKRAICLARDKLGGKLCQITYRIDGKE